MIKPYFLMALTASMVLVSCTQASESKGGGESEQLLAAEGSWNLVEEDKSANPVAQNLQARGQVDPAQTTDSRGYTTKGAPGDEGSVHFRVLRLENEVAGLRNDFKKLLPPLSQLIVSDRVLDQAITEIQAHQDQPAPMPAAPVSAASAGVPAAQKPLASAQAPVSLAPPAMTAEAAASPLPGAGPSKVPPPSFANPAKPPAQDAPQAAAKSVEPAAASKAPAAASLPGKTAVATSAPAAAPAATAPATPSPAVGGATISGVRFGQHPGKTRLVLDASAPVKFNYDLDNAEKLLLVELPGTSWSGPAQQSLSGNPLIKSYTAQPSAAGGTTLAIELQKDAKIVMATALGPGESLGNRVVFDLAPL